MNIRLGADLVYGYDASGTRLFKVVIPKQQNGASTGTRMSQEHWDTTWYIKDASGNAMATYKTTHTRIYTAQPQNSTLKKQFFTEELYIYGSNRHGVLKASDLLSEKEYALSLGQYVVPDSTFPQVQEGEFETIGSTQTITVNYEQGEFTFARGAKQYELSNHLGNVLVTIQDRKWGIQTTSGNNANHYIPYIVTTTDYYAFGSSMVERSQSFGEIYKFGFNNQEKEGDPGSNREGDYYSFEYRVHDARLGRFLSVDPLNNKYPFYSVYSYSGNRVIDCRDLEGLEPESIVSSLDENNTKFELTNRAKIFFQLMTVTSATHLNSVYIDSKSNGSSGGMTIGYHVGLNKSNYFSSSDKNSTTELKSWILILSHELWHVYQYFDVFGYTEGSSWDEFLYLEEFTSCYIKAGGHDGCIWEQVAETGPMVLGYKKESNKYVTISTIGAKKTTFTIRGMSKEVFKGFDNYISVAFESDEAMTLFANRYKRFNFIKEKSDGKVIFENYTQLCASKDFIVNGPTGDVNFRSSPEYKSDDSNVSLVIVNNTKLYGTGKTQNGYSEVVTGDGQVGWIYSSLLK